MNWKLAIVSLICLSALMAGAVKLRPEGLPVHWVDVFSSIAFVVLVASLFGILSSPSERAKTSPPPIRPRIPGR